jgi:dUTP pyrophosphatase
MDNTVRFFKKDKDAIIPTSKEGNAGFDLYTTSVVLQSGDQELDISVGKDIYSVIPGKIYKAKTGIGCEIPDDYVGFVWPRSGVSLRYGVNILAGVIDSSYRGEIMVVFTVAKEFEIKKGDRLAQMVVTPYLAKSLEVSEETKTDRGEKGFGSTGK